MLSVSKVQSNGSVVISTRGLRRIISESGKVINEFIEAKNAAKNVANYNSMFPNGESRAEAITYQEAARREAAKSKRSPQPRLKKLRIALVA